jgi:hypothetical protein
MLKSTALADLLHLVNCYPVSPAFGVPPTCFWFVSCFDAYIVVVFSVYSTNPEAEKAHMAKFSELMKKEYTPKTMEFALAQGLLTMRCTKAKKYAEETMGATLGLKNYMSAGKEDRVHLDTVVPTL